jgi:hypothetical protein
MNHAGHVRPARSARGVCHVHHVRQNLDVGLRGDFFEVYAREAVGESYGKLIRVDSFPKGTRTATGNTSRE